jgi:hypothetical protein
VPLRPQPFEKGNDVAFKRRSKGKGDAGDLAGTDPEVDETAYDDALEDFDPAERPYRQGAESLRSSGPWDVDEAPADKIDRVDLGGVQIPIVNGMELRAEIAEERIVAATLIIGQSALQIQPFAAPRTMGIWDEVRAEIDAGIRGQGGYAEEAEGRFGTELHAQVPVRLPDGTEGIQIARFIGIDGPRWFLRAVITGEAAVEPRAAGPLEELLSDVIVVRGSDPMAPRDPIELRVPVDLEPGEVGEHYEEEPTRMDDLNPFERGPEITETR